MSEWAWSSEPDLVEKTRVLARLLASATSDGWTSETPQAVIDDLGLTRVNANRFADALERSGQLVATLGGTATVNPAAWAMLSAAADSAVQRLASSATVSG